MATFLLTGGRRWEVFCLQVSDIDFDKGLVHFRPNAFYPELKSRHAVRSVPLWPQLRDVLVPYIGDRKNGLLFAMPSGKPPKDLRASMAKVFASAGVDRPKGEDWKIFRHTYGAMRLQTLDGGEPVSPWTVKDELGHGSLALLEQIYGHLLKHRDSRLEAVEYRPLKAVESAEGAA